MNVLDVIAISVCTIFGAATLLGILFWVIVMIVNHCGDYENEENKYFYGEE